MSIEDAQNLLKHKKGLFILVGTENGTIDMDNLKGYIAYISDTKASFSELLNEYGRVKKKQQAIVIGSYKDGGAIGVQYQL